MYVSCMHVCMQTHGMGVWLLCNAHSMNAMSSAEMVSYAATGITSCPHRPQLVQQPAGHVSHSSRFFCRLGTECSGCGQREQHWPGSGQGLEHSNQRLHSKTHTTFSPSLTPCLQKSKTPRKDRHVGKPQALADMAIQIVMAHRDE